MNKEKLKDSEIEEKNTEGVRWLKRKNDMMKLIEEGTKEFPYEVL